MLSRRNRRHVAGVAGVANRRRSSAFRSPPGPKTDQPWCCRILRRTTSQRTVITGRPPQDLEQQPAVSTPASDPITGGGDRPESAIDVMRRKNRGVGFEDDERRPWRPHGRGAQSLARQEMTDALKRLLGARPNWRRSGDEGAALPTYGRVEAATSSR